MSIASSTPATNERGTPLGTSPYDFSLGASSSSSKTTPRSASTAAHALALAGSQALPPESLLVLLILDHPAVRTRWSSVAYPFLEAVTNKFASLHSGSRLMIGAAIYRPSSDNQSKIRSPSSLVKLPFVPGSKFIDMVKKGDSWIDTQSASRTSSQWDWLELHASFTSDDQNALSDGQDKPAARALEAFAGALELFDVRDGSQRSANTAAYNPIAPQSPPIMARHLVHITTEDSLVRLDLSEPPLFNADISCDQATMAEICARISAKGTSVSTCALRQLPIPPQVPDEKQAYEQAHELVAASSGGLKEDLSLTFSNILRTRLLKESNIVISGLNNNVPTRKRSRTQDSSDAPEDSVAKRSKSGSFSKDDQAFAAAAAASMSAAAASLPAQAAALQQKIPKLDPTVSTKIIFLKQQQEIMFRNLSLIAAQVLKAENDGAPKNPAPGMNRPYLEQLRNQLIAQQQGLRLLIQKVITTGEVPNFNLCFHSLVNIDKEAKDMGVHLGGPSSAQAAAGSGAGSFASAAAAAAAAAARPAPVPAPVSAPVPIVSAPIQAQPAPAAAAAAAAAVGQRPKPFWTGAITWSVISDAATKQKRDIATLVSATSNTNAHDKLMGPWPERLQISAISQLNPRNLQLYAQSQGAAYVLFAAEGEARNTAMYSSLAGSLDAKKSCAFIRHGQAPGAGIVLFAATQAAGTRLIGVVFREAVPFAKLMAAQQAPPTVVKDEQNA